MRDGFIELARSLALLAIKDDTRTAISVRAIDVATGRGNPTEPNRLSHPVVVS